MLLVVTLYLIHHNPIVLANVYTVQLSLGLLYNTGRKLMLINIDGFVIDWELIKWSQ